MSGVVKGLVGEQVVHGVIVRVHSDHSGLRIKNMVYFFENYTISLKGNIKNENTLPSHLSIPEPLGKVIYKLPMTTNILQVSFVGSF